MRMKRRHLIMLTAGTVCLGATAWHQLRPSAALIDWFSQPAKRPTDLITDTGLTPCPGAPFILPSAGLIGLLWNDTRLPYSPFHRHSGIDIFGDGEPNQVPVYAAYDGYLTRLPNWRSAVIIRHPQDPLDATRQIWTYYAHMANKDGESFIIDDFPPGSYNVPVSQGTLLGYQGNYNGGNGEVGLHLHFSIVRSDNAGQFLNETNIKNTLDPSPYLGMRLNSACAGQVPDCSPTPLCQN